MELSGSWGVIIPWRYLRFSYLYLGHGFITETNQDINMCDIVPLTFFFLWPLGLTQSWKVCKIVIPLLTPCEIWRNGGDDSLAWGHRYWWENQTEQPGFLVSISMISQLVHLVKSSEYFVPQLWQSLFCHLVIAWPWAKCLISLNLKVLGRLNEWMKLIAHFSFNRIH